MFRANGLRLPDLTITGFRGIDKLHIPRLGRVTLLAGKNSIGKTTVLDAVGVYAAPGSASALYNLLWNREEVFAATDEDGDTVLVPDWRALFYNRDASLGSNISIGPADWEEKLIIESSVSKGAQPELFGDGIDDEHTQVLSAKYGGAQVWAIPLNAQPPFRLPRAAGRRGQLALFDEDELRSTIGCEVLGPGLLGNNHLSRLWDGVALTNDEDRAVGALRLVYGANMERVAVVGDDMVYPRRSGRRAVVRLKGQDRPVPLRSLGDGALRMLGVALALANSRGGFLLIDEAENGIHYSLQNDFWNMVIRTAHDNDVQVVATTHSSDCIKGFAKAASEIGDAEGLLLRLSRKYGDLRAVEYSEEELTIATEQGIEVR